MHYNNDNDAITKYRELCEREPSIPLFCKAWWLDSVSENDTWNVILVYKKNSIIGAMPYIITKGFFGLPQIVMPKLTPYIGVWIKYPHGQKYIKRISYEKKVFGEIIRALDGLQVAYFSQHFHYSITNWLPFFWQGFKQTTRYTYVHDDMSNLDKLYGDFENSKRYQIRKAEDFLSVKNDLDAAAFFKYHNSILHKQKRRISYSLPMLEKIFKNALERGQGKVFYGEDKQGLIHGATFIIWDGMSAYWLINAIDPALKVSGVSSLLVWEGIKYVSTRTQCFDFEGSMIESYEQSFRFFGGVQKPYFNIRKTYSQFYQMRDGYNQFKSGLKQELKKYLKKK